MTDAVDLPRRLLLLRHGQTAWNLARRVQGQIDVPLDDVGLLQADVVAPVLADMRPTFVWSSDLVRARATAEKVAAAAGLEVVVDARLREFDLGERAGTTLSDYAATHADEYMAFRSGRYDVVPGGESREELVARFVPVLAEAMSRLSAGELGIVVAHGAALKVSLTAWLGWAPEMATTLHALGNCHWAMIDDSGEPSAPSSGRRLVAFNQHV